MIREFNALTPTLTYLRTRFYFEFMLDEIFITDLVCRRRYRLTFTGNPDMPLVIELVEKE